MSALAGALAHRRATPSAAAVGLATLAALAAGLAVGAAPLPVLAGLAGACALVVSLVRPEVATLLAVLLLYTNVPTVAYVEHGAPYLLSAAVVPVLLGVAVLGHLARGEGVVATRAAVLVALLLAVNVAATMFAERPEVATEELLTFAVEGVVLFLLVLNAVRTPEMLRAALWTILAGAAFLAVVTVHQRLTGAPLRPYGGFGLVDSYFLIGKTEVPRSAGPIGDPNYFAQILVAALPIGILSALHERRPSLRALAAGLTAIVGAAVMFTDSRGAFVALIVAIVVMAAIGQLRARHVVAVLAAGALLLAFVPSYAERVASLTGVGTAATAEAGTAGAEDAAVRGRSTEMLVAAQTFVDHPVIGVGPGVAPELFQFYAARLGTDVHQTAIVGPEQGTAPAREAHNMLLTVLAELGVVGALVFLALLAVIVRDVARARRRAARDGTALAVPAAAMLLALSAYLAAGLFLSLGFERYFWLLLGLAAATAAIDRRRRPPARRLA